MDGQSYGIQWIQHHVSDDMKTTRQLIIADQPPENVHDLMNNVSSGGHVAHHHHHHPQDYLVHDVPTEEDIDQIAAENLIFMAHDGQVVTEIISATTDAHGAVVVSASDGTPIDCALLSTGRATADGNLDAGAAEHAIQIHTNSNNGSLVQYTEDYAETQMVTEEVITDDWVQHQGEERVEISADQIIGSSSHAAIENEVPLPTVQDEYTALRPYPCDFCSRRFRKKTSLMNHMVAHQNDRPHLCKLCGSRFFRRSDLINHLKAHAETPDPEFDDVDFMNFVEQAALDQHHKQQQQQQQQQHANDHYYDQDWSIQPVPASSASSAMPKSNRSRSQQAHSSTNSSSTSNAPRGRISRIKPKEENNYTIDETLRTKVENASHSTEFNYDESANLQASSASVKLVQDVSQPVEQQLNHFPVIDESKPFVCQQCGLAFAREKALHSHVKSHRNDSPYECSQCNEMFWDSPSLQEHIKTHQFEESNSEYEPGDAEETQTDSESEYLYGEFYCSVCGMSFHRQDLLKRHAKVHVKEDEDAKNRHCCHTCGETFAEALDLLAHAEIHARYPPFKCVLCGESFFEETTIKRHLNSTHANEMTANSCILCGKECRDRKALMKHAWDHSREKCHSCSKCGKNFHNKARLKRHMASHRDKSVACDVCHEEFPDGRTLSNHRHSHSTTASGKLFPCHECGKTFGSRSSQQIHVRIHTGERPYGCRFCWKAFADGGTLRKHERIHTGEKPYACSVCPRAFNQRVVLREHIRSHHSGLDSKRGSYFCSVCSAELSSSNDLIQHLIQHSDMNTAMQRQPVTGPRKYKRRRKLKPHELAHLRTESKGNQEGGEVGSDIDISDFDIDAVDDLLGMQENDAAALVPSGAQTKRRIKQDSNSELVDMTGGSTIVHDETSTSKKEIFDSTDNNSDSKLNSWQAKLMNSNSNVDSYKSLLSNLENTLQSIDTLVVNSNSSSNTTKNNNNRKIHEDVTERSPKMNSRNHVKSKSANPATQAAAARVRSNKRVNNKLNKSARPRMIHTERTRSNTKADNSSNKRRSKTQITRSEPASKMELLDNSVTTRHNKSSNSLVNDYEIIIPDMQPPNQISSSPVHEVVKNSGHHNNEHSHQKRANDIYSTQLLLESTTLRKEEYEKFNPNIVNDLEEILRSPSKSEKSRTRFVSESSTTANYLVDQSEEEQNLIKIEPTSPDIHDIVVGGTSSSSASAPSNRHSAQRSTRRRPISNRKYLEFETELSHLGSSDASDSKNRLGSSNKSLDLNTSSCSSKNFLSYVADDGYDEAVVASNSISESSTSGNNSFSSISAVIAAATANAAAEAAAANVSKRRYFECEMCSSVFPDRAQLLDHVPIHI